MLIVNCRRIAMRSTVAPMLFAVLLIGCSRGGAKVEDPAIKHIAEGKKALKARDCDLGLHCFDEAIQANPSIAEAHAGKASACLCKSDYRQAAESASEAIRLDPTMIAAYKTRSIIYFATDQLPLAIQDISVVIEANPDAENYVSRGNYFRYIGMEEEARKDYLKAGAMDPRHKGDADLYVPLKHAASARAASGN